MDSDWSSCNMLISCYTAVGDDEASRAAAQRTLERAEKLVMLEPSNGDVMAGAVDALARLGAAERVREWAERAVLLDPDNMNMRYNIVCTLLLEGRRRGCGSLRIPRAP